MRTKLLETWFAVLLFAAFALGTVCTVRQVIWSPKDEIAHFDYIHRLSSGRLPRSDEPISERTFAMTVSGLHWAKPPDFDGSLATMGVAGVSYEAWQPPLYYALLALPNLVLDWCAVSATTQIMTLRLLQLFLVYAGILMVVVLFAELARLGAADRTVGWLLAVVLAVTNLQHYFSLGNDNLSVLLGSSFLWLHARHVRLGKRTDLWAAALVAGLGFWCKYSNGLLMVMHAAACVFLRPRAGPERSPLARLAANALPAALPIAMALALLAHNQLRFGDALNTSITAARFTPLVLSTDNVPLFLTFLVHDSLLRVWVNGAIFTSEFPHTFGWWWWFAAALATNAVLLAVCAIRRRWGPRQVFVLAAVVVTSTVVGIASLLNLWKPVANWYNFRHFFAYAVFWFVAVSFCAVPLPATLGRLVTVLFGVAATGVVIHFAWIVAQ